MHDGNYNSKRNNTHAFTLIELLVVVSIIAILMGMIIPVFSHMREKARITAAKATAKNLELAFRAYLDHYKTWKFSPSDTEMKIEDDLVKMLRGEDVDNPDKIAFYEFSNTNAGDKAADPWFDPDPSRAPANNDDRVYRVKFDHDYNNEIEAPGGAKIYRPVIVWSQGPPDKEGEIITSW